MKNPKAFQVQTQLLGAMFGPGRSRIPCIEQVSKAMLKLKFLEFSNLIEVMVYGNYMYKLQTKWRFRFTACGRKEGCSDLRKP